MRFSCILGTYNRAATQPHLLEEAVESFLRQDYEDKELVILNDCAGQEIVFDHPQVRVFNVAQRFGTLGEKLEAGVRLSTGDAICEWDDDDISLPWRLSWHAAVLRDFDVDHPGGYFFWDRDGLHTEHGIGYCLNCAAWTRAAHDRAWGYPPINKAIEAPMLSKMYATSRIRPGREQHTPKDWSYIYRWGVSALHLSGFADMDAAYARQATTATARGRFEIVPRWHRDYVAAVREVLR